MQPHKKSFFEDFSIAFSKPQIWEKCRLLSLLLPRGTPNELHVVFSQICGDVFGYGAGGVGMGWDIANMSRGASYGGGLTKSYRDFHEVLTFLGSSGPLFDVIQRLMHDPSHVYEFQTSQLPQSFQKNNLSGGTVAVTAFEYYFYHFASLLVRRQKLNLASSNININSNPGDNLYPLLLEDYLSCFLPIDPALQSQLFTKTLFQPAMSPQSTAMTSPTSSASSRTPTKPSMFKKDFSPRVKTEPKQEFRPVRDNSKAQSSSINNETWRSDTLVRSLIMFWIENYSGEDENSSNDNNSPGGGSATKPSLDYVTASIRVQNSMPSPELMRVVRMFVKHAHYFANLCGSVYLPASMKIDIFGSRSNKNLLLNFLARSIDHWPYDASFRFVLETWLSYIQPWRYLNINENENDGGQILDTAKFSSFISENFMFYSKLFSKVLNRFRFQYNVGSPKNAYMLFRVFKVFSQENLFPCLKSIAYSQGYNLNQTQYVKKIDNIFSEEFKDLMGTLMMAVLKSIEIEKKNCKSAANVQGKAKLAAEKSSSFLTNLVDFINGGSTHSTVSDAEKQESEKVLANLTFVSDKMASMFDLSHVLDQYQITLASRKESIDESDFQTSPLQGLSPEQRKGILYKKFKPDVQHRGNPDLVPIRSDEIGILVRLLYQLSCWINSKWGDKIEESYYKKDFVGAFLREMALIPTTYMTRIDQIDSSLNHSRLTNSSFHGIPKQPVKLGPRIQLRFMGSYMAVTYFTLYLFFMTILLGKSLSTAVILLVFGFMCYFAFKAVFSPSQECKLENMNNSSFFSESFS